MAIALDSTGSGRSSSGSVSYTHTVGAGLSNSIALVGVSIQDSNHANMSMNDITFGGKTMTLARRDEAAGNVCTFIYYLLNPPSGAQTVLVTCANGASVNDTGVGSIVLSGVDPYDPIDAVNGATGNSSSPSVSLTTVADNAWTFTVISSESATTAVGTQTAAWADLTDQSYEHCRGAYKGPVTPAGSTALGYTLASGQPWAESAVSVKPVTGSTPVILVDGLSKSDGAAVSSLTFSHTVTSNSDGMLVVAAGARDGTANDMIITGITFNGDALTKLRSDLYNTSTYVRSELWYRKLPDVATGNIVITYTGTCDFVYGVGMSFTGVDQTAGLEANDGTGTTTSPTGDSATPNKAITTLTDNAVLVFSAWLKDGAQIGTTTYKQLVVGRKYVSSPVDINEGGYERVGTAGSKTVGWTNKNSDGYAISLGAMKPAAGSVATNSSRPAVITGKDTANASRGALTAGKDATNSSRSATLLGKDSANASRGAVITGKDTSNASRGATTTGIDAANSSRGAVVTGKDTTSASRAAKITGAEGADDDRNAILTGIDAAASSREAVITGKDTSNDSRGAIVTGIDSADSSRPAIVSGQDSTNATRGAVITGKDTAVSGRGAISTGIAEANDSRGAIVTGKETANDSRGVVITGKDTASDSRGAKIHGTEQIVSAVMARLWGKDTSFSERGAILTGFAIASDSRGAVLVGKLDRGRPTVLPAAVGATILASRQSRTTIPSRTPTIL